MTLPASLQTLSFDGLFNQPLLRHAMTEHELQAAVAELPGDKTIKNRNEKCGEMVLPMNFSPYECKT